MRPPLFPQPSSELWKILRNSILLRYILLFSCGWITVTLIHYFYSTIAVFTAAGIFAVLLNYPVVWLSRYMPRGLAITFTFITAIVLLLGLATLLGLQILSQGQGLLLQLRDVLNHQDIQPLQAFLDRLELSKLIDALRISLVTGVGIGKSFFSSLFIGIFGAVISLYMLIDGEKLWQSCLNRLPTPIRARFGRTFQKSFLGFIRGQLLLMLFLSSTTLLIYPFLGVNYALILAIVIGLIDAIPGIGATLGVTVVTFLVFASQGAAIAVRVLAVSIVLIQIQDNYVRPKVMGDALELNPVLLFLALFIGERVAGLLGVFLSIPIAGMIALWMQPDAEAAPPILVEPSDAEPNELGS